MPHTPVAKQPAIGHIASRSTFDRATAPSTRPLVDKRRARRDDSGLFRLRPSTTAPLHRNGGRLSSALTTEPHSRHDPNFSGLSPRSEPGRTIWTANPTRVFNGRPKTRCSDLAAPIASTTRKPDGRRRDLVSVRSTVRDHLAASMVAHVVAARTANDGDGRWMRDAASSVAVRTHHIVAHGLPVSRVQRTVLWARSLAPPLSPFRSPMLPSYRPASRALPTSRETSPTARTCCMSPSRSLHICRLLYTSGMERRGRRWPQIRRREDRATPLPRQHHSCRILRAGSHPDTERFGSRSRSSRPHSCAGFGLRSLLAPHVIAVA
jgi:hypothetical protein